MMDTRECIVCMTPGTEREGRGDGDVVVHNCPRCGVFSLTGTAEATLPSWIKRKPHWPALVSHTIRRMQREGQSPSLISDADFASFVFRDKLPSPQEQADSLVLWIGDHQTSPERPANAPELALDAWIGAALAPTRGNAAGLRWLIQELETESLFKVRYERQIAYLQLTLAGWNRYSALQQKRADSRTAFIAMKFDDSQLDEVVARCFRPAVAATGFELRKLTDSQPAGLIDNQIRAAILSGRFVIADLTHGSHGAYWEAGYAEGLGLPVIYTCESTKWKESRTHFDTNHMVTIIWDFANLDKAGRELTATIRATLRAEAKQTGE